MVSLVGKVLSNLPMIDRSVVSTDNEEIARVAEDAGISAPFRRPSDISGDKIGDLEVLRHALLEMEAMDNVTYDIVLMLQPTSPLRQSKHVSDALTMLIEGAWDAVWTVSITESKSHPLKQLCIHESKLGYYDSSGQEIIARQQLSPVYHRNGVAYALTRDCLMNQVALLGNRTGALVLHGDFVSIDTEYDIKLAEWIMERGSTTDKFTE
jgi:CMP-N-acetylneuraminic acid synthetase